MARVKISPDGTEAALYRARSSSDPYPWQVTGRTGRDEDAKVADWTELVPAVDQKTDRTVIVDAVLNNETRLMDILAKFESAVQAETVVDYTYRGVLAEMMMIMNGDLS